MKKTISFGILHFMVAFGVTYALTGDLIIGGAVALIEPALNTVAFHFHEKVWKRYERKEALEQAALKAEREKCVA
ncbi:DUF2061 domain-containing protein [Nitrincola tapanii]|uniref:DUF2061 domain-containing protein n=1 Tax=Nitrincola tapanii TaxID=1708751 RepID=A0A5A9W2Y6_9GAMM|nr:DUF2061 domain-containing protein [Nitrincola tapanii]KAA0874962.1 DUF2061 domain-containing protein [Nitrincola tapanii]